MRIYKIASLILILLFHPDNASPWSSGNTGASLTSTTVAPLTSTDIALFDEEELMYDDVSTVKKEKDRAKKRAYVRMVTNVNNGGSLNLELFCEKVIDVNERASTIKRN